MGVTQGRGTRERKPVGAEADDPDQPDDPPQRSS